MRGGRRAAGLAGPGRRLVPRRLRAGPQSRDVARRGPGAGRAPVRRRARAAATFTVAGAVRRGLAGGRLRRREAARVRPQARAARRRRLPGRPSDPGGARRESRSSARAWRGAAAARAVRALGGEPLVFDAEGPGAGASGNPAALVTPRLDAGLGPPAPSCSPRRSARGRPLRGHPGRGHRPRRPAGRRCSRATNARFAKIAAAALFEPGALAMLAPAEAAIRLGERGAGGAAASRRAW